MRATYLLPVLLLAAGVGWFLRGGAREVDGHESYEAQAPLPDPVDPEPARELSTPTVIPAKLVPRAPAPVETSTSSETPAWTPPRGVDRRSYMVGGESSRSWPMEARAKKVSALLEAGRATLEELPEEDREAYEAWREILRQKGIRDD